MHLSGLLDSSPRAKHAKTKFTSEFHGTRIFSNQVRLEDNRFSSFAVRDNRLREFQDRWEMADVGKFQRNRLGILEQRLRARGRRPRQIQVRRSRSNQNPDALRHVGLSTGNLRRSHDTARAGRRRARVYEDRRSTAVTSLESTKRSEIPRRSCPERSRRARNDKGQNSALPGVRAKGMTSRMFATPVMNISIRSKPRPNPECGAVP